MDFENTSPCPFIRIIEIVTSLLFSLFCIWCIKFSRVYSYKTYSMATILVHVANLLVTSRLINNEITEPYLVLIVLSIEYAEFLL